ncbi:MAG TPA: secretin N-terminal domain-containing protein [Gemmatimonadaceae bacterium]|nr:secretin N-terminal domain-containing protein [Gemmatimonadaceae bacterium]
MLRTRITALMLLSPIILPAQQAATRPTPAKASADSIDQLPVSGSGDSVRIHLVDADLRAAVQALAPYLDRPVVFGPMAAGARVSLEMPHPVPRSDVRQLLESLLESQNLSLVSDSGLYRVGTREAHPPAAAPTPARGVGGVGSATQAIQLFVIRLHHARAADVAATVNALYGKASALGEIGAGPNAQPPTLSQQLEANHVPAAGLSPPDNSSPAVVSRAATFNGDVTIVPDPRSNSLLIRASAHDYALIQAAVDQLDTRPLQVLIEVVIAEVQRNWSLTFGVNGNAPPASVNHGKTTVAETVNGNSGVSDFVLQIMNLGRLNINATLSAAEEQGEVRILSRPVVIASNNEVASINVGSQRPFVQVSRALPNDEATQDQVVQYKDVGTKLTVSPTISPDGYVVLQVSQEVDNATAEVAFDAPVISTRSVQTELLIKDGQTVALGGLSDRQHDTNQGGIPLLSKIPLIGGLFGHASRDMTDDELYLFLTPHVIRTDADADSLTSPMLKKAQAVNP